MKHRESPRRHSTSERLFSVLVLLAVAIRLLCVPRITADLIVYLGPWHRTAQMYGMRVLGLEFTDYPPLFSYFLLLVAPLPLPFAIKVVSISFDFLAAFLMRRLVQRRYEEPWVGRAAFLSVLFAPTVILNGSYWGQNDILFSTFLLACVLCAVEGRPWLCILSFSAAFALKLQSIFLLPFLILLAVTRRIPWKGLALVPSVYVLAAIPCVLFGRSVSSLMRVYLGQAEFGRRLVFQSANLYQFVPKHHYDAGLILGLACSAVVGMLLPLLGWRRNVQMSPAIILKAAALSVSMMPFFLPKMRARYFFPADLLSIGLAFYQPRLFFVPVAFQFTSAFSYTRYLWHRIFVPYRLLSSVNGLMVAILFWDFWQSVRAGQVPEALPSVVDEPPRCG